MLNMRIRGFPRIKILIILCIKYYIRVWLNSLLDHLKQTKCVEKNKHWKLSI